MDTTTRSEEFYTLTINGVSGEHSKNYVLPTGCFQLGAPILDANPFNYDTLKDSWSNSTSIPTEEDIKAAAILWAEAQEKLKYKQQRKVGIGTTSGYPSIEYQLDQLYHDMKNNTLNTSGEWYVGITSVKTSFPKPS